MRICRDKQIRGFFLFLTFFAVLLFGLGIIFGISQINDIKTLYLTHDEAVASSRLGQGIPKDVIAVALTNTEISEDGQILLAAAGIGADVENNMLPFVNQFQQSTFYTMLGMEIFLLLILATGILLFFWKRNWRSGNITILRQSAIFTLSNAILPKRVCTDTVSPRLRGAP